MKEDILKVSLPRRLPGSSPVAGMNFKAEAHANLISKIPAPITFSYHTYVQCTYVYINTLLTRGERLGNIGLHSPPPPPTKTVQIKIPFDKKETESAYKNKSKKNRQKNPS